MVLAGRRGGDRDIDGQGVVTIETAAYCPTFLMLARDIVASRMNNYIQLSYSYT